MFQLRSFHQWIQRNIVRTKTKTLKCCPHRLFLLLDRYLSEMFSTILEWHDSTTQRLTTSQIKSSTWNALSYISFFQKWRITGSKHSNVNSQFIRGHILSILYYLLGVMDHIHLWQPFIVCCQTDNFLHMRSCILKS